jgi:hypothetical protein
LRGGGVKREVIVGTHSMSNGCVEVAFVDGGARGGDFDVPPGLPPRYALEVAPAEPALYDPHLREVEVDQRGAGKIEAIPDQ